MYRENQLRKQEEEKFQDYGSYLRSLNMTAHIHPFQEAEWDRIFQLIQKSNQFNLTTRRYTMGEIKNISQSQNYITLSGRLVDKFGDNGIVSLLIAEKEGETAHIRLWVMSCRVLGRDMEYAMFDELGNACRESGIKQMKGYFYPTKKNGIVKDLYEKLGFENEDDQTWHYSVKDKEILKNQFITVETERE